MTKPKDESKSKTDADAVGGASPGTDVAVQQQGNTAVTVFDDYGNDAGAGMENVGIEEYRIPFLRILQALSPACQPVEAGGIEGARQGMLINTATQELIDPKKERIIFIPCARDHNYVEFPPRTGGGTGVGFQGAHEPDDPAILAMRATQGRFGKLMADNGNEISEVYYLYGIALIGDRSPLRCMVGFSGSQIKKYQAFIGLQMGIEFKVKGAEGQPDRLVKPPMWAIQWHLTTVFEKGKKGDYYNWQLQLANTDKDNRPSALASLIKKSDPLYAAGADFYNLIKSGTAKVDLSQIGPADSEVEAGTPATAGTQGSAPVGGALDEEIPF